MKNCEYYQALISNQIDGAIDPNQLTELKEHEKNCSDCAEFRAMIVRQGKLLEKLPSRILNAPLVGREPKAVSWLQNIWSAKITIPMPAAAIIVLMMISFLIYSNGFNPQEDYNKLASDDSSLLIETVIMQPQSAILVTNNN